MKANEERILSILEMYQDKKYLDAHAALVMFEKSGGSVPHANGMVDVNILDAVVHESKAKAATELMRIISDVINSVELLKRPQRG